jgi:hypothetical protein
MLAETRQARLPIEFADWQDAQKEAKIGAGSGRGHRKKVKPGIHSKDRNLRSRLTH